MSRNATHALDAPPWQRVEHTLMTTANEIRSAYNRCFASLDLNISQATLIGYIAENGPMTQTELATALVLGRAATGAVVDQLETRGLVRRLPNPEDRRVWLVENTIDGSELAANIITVDKELRSALRSGTTQVERRQLADVLLRLSANAAATDPSHPTNL